MMYAGSGTNKASNATTNGNVHLKLFDNDANRANIKFQGAGGAIVTTDANGVVTISSQVNTNTTYADGRFVKISGATNTINVTLTGLDQLTNTPGYITSYTDTKYYAKANGGLSLDSNNQFAITGLTKAQVTTALGYTPPTTDTNTTYAAGRLISITGTNNSINFTGNIPTKVSQLSNDIGYITSDQFLSGA